MRKIIASIIAACLAFGLVGCGNGVQDGTQQAAQSVAVEGRPWNNTSIVGNLPKEAPSAKEDLYTAYNYGWLAANAGTFDGTAKYGVREEQGKRNRENLVDAIKTTAQSDHATDLVKTIFGAAADWDARNEAGLDPIRAAVEEVAAIQSIDQLTEYLASPEYKLGGSLMSAEIQPNAYDNSRYVLILGAPDVEGDTAADSPYAPMMEKMGLSEEDTREMESAAAAIGKAIQESETDVDASMDSLEAIISLSGNPITVDELAAKSTAYPLVAILQAKGYTQASQISLLGSQWLDEMNSLYVEENLAGFKGMLIHEIINKMALYLDEDAFELNAAKYGSADLMALEVTRSVLGDALYKIYADNYLKEETLEDVATMVEELRGTLRGRLQNTEWLSDETRARALEKLDAITVRVGHGDAWRDYSELTLPEGETAVLGDYVIDILAFEDKAEREKLSQPVNYDYWPGETMAVYDVGAFYSPQDNSINIPAGALGGCFYHAEGTNEERYSAIGTIIGHELTHGFDTLGSQFDAAGNFANWWTAEDKQQFIEKNQEVIDYFSTIEPHLGEGLPAENQIGEITADMGGMSLVLETLEQKGAVDYEKAFKTYTELWGEVLDADIAEKLLQNDVHPPKYVRVNGVAQQFEQFYQTYGVQEGDAMYLAPEKRVSVW